MRFLKVHGQSGTRNSLTRDLPDNKGPKYAILSHYWAQDNIEEVTLANLETKPKRLKSGYKKIRFCETQAQQDGIKHIWIDTCCIDRTNNVELSEAITSMFRWYREAEKCYMYLSGRLMSVYRRSAGYK